MNFGLRLVGVNDGEMTGSCGEDDTDRQCDESLFCLFWLFISDEN